MHVPGIFDLAARSRPDASPLDTLLRLATLLLSTALLALATALLALSRPAYWWFLPPGALYLVWQACVLVLARRGVRLPGPAAVALDLLLALSAVAFVLFARPLGGGGAPVRMVIAGQGITGLIACVYPFF